MVVLLLFQFSLFIPQQVDNKEKSSTQFLLYIPPQKRNAQEFRDREKVLFSSFDVTPKEIIAQIFQWKVVGDSNNNNKNNTTPSTIQATGKKKKKNQLI